MTKTEIKILKELLKEALATGYFESNHKAWEKIELNPDVAIKHLLTWIAEDPEMYPLNDDEEEEA